MNGKNWYATVKYIHRHLNGLTEFVPVSDISEVSPPPELRTSQFIPITLDSYVLGKVYSVRTLLKSGDKQKHSYFAFIGRMAASLEDLQNEGSSQRIRWPTQIPPGYEEDPQHSESDEQRQQAAVGLAVFNQHKQRKKAVTSSQVVRHTTELDNYMRGNSLLINAGPREERPNEELLKRIEELEHEVQRKNQEVEAAKMRSQENVVATMLNDLKESFANDLKALEARLEGRIVDAVDSRISARLSKSQAARLKAVRKWLEKTN